MRPQIGESHSGCIWIGPPQAALSTKPASDYRRLVDGMAAAVKAKGCAFIDSDPLSNRANVLKGDREGTHYNADGEKAWERKVWSVLQPVLRTELAH